MNTRKAKKRVLEALSPTEKAGVLADLLTAHPELVEDAERLATARLEHVDRADVAEEVAWALQSLTVEEVWERGHQEPGFVHENEAAFMAGEGVVQPYLDDMRRAAALGMDETACETCWGVLLGLYECRDLDDDSGLGRAPAPDFTTEHAVYVLGELRGAGLDLPRDAPAAEMPEWSALLRRQSP
ncbi:MAG: hypothetical protein GEU81_11685 [Nitriliruptorales bacterium]|nr:hypothetical protein [Nitriliruptorales bacterium]